MINFDWSINIDNPAVVYNNRFSIYYPFNVIAELHISLLLVIYQVQQSQVLDLLETSHKINSLHHIIE